MQSSELDRRLQIVRDIARAAGDTVLQFYSAQVEVEWKAPGNPVTAADHSANALILEHLHRHFPGEAVLAEETTDDMSRLGRDIVWFVDPLDGTKEFISRNGEFTVNIALIEHGEPVLGLVHAPALKKTFAGATGCGAFIENCIGRRPIKCRRPPLEGLSVVASRSHGDAAALDAFLAGRKVGELKSAGSSLKLCLIAAGEADLYPRLGRTMEWDIAAGHAVLVAAGGSVTQLSGSRLNYGKPGFDNPHFVAQGLTG